MFNFFNPYTVWLGIAHIPLFLISLYCAILSYHLVTDQFPCTVLHCFSCGDYADIDIEPPCSQLIINGIFHQMSPFVLPEVDACIP